MIKIIKQPKTYEITCSNYQCQAVLRFNAGDISANPYGHDVIICPICKRHIEITNLKEVTD